MKEKYKCKYCNKCFQNAVPIERMHLAQHISEKLKMLFTVNQYHKSEETLVMQMMGELEKSLTMEVLVRTGIIKTKD